MKKVYYYSRLYPEYGIKSFYAKDLLYLKGKNIKILEYLVSEFDISTEQVSEEDDFWISVYSPYEDEDIFVHDKPHSAYGSDYIMSFNKEKLKEWFEITCNSQKEKLENRLQKFSLLNKESE